MSDTTTSTHTTTEPTRPVEHAKYTTADANNSAQNSSPESPLRLVNEKKEVLLSGGAGAISFQAGYMHRLRQIIPLDVLKSFRYGGVSAGACVAGFFVMTLYSDRDMKYFYEKAIKYTMKVSSESLLSCWNLTNVVVGVAASAYRESKECNVNLEGIFHMYVSVRRGLFGYERHLIDKFPSEQHFAEAMAASCAIPFVTVQGASRDFQGMRAVDGGVTMPIPFKNPHSECIFLNALPKPFRSFPIAREQPDNMTVIDIAEDYKMSFPADYWLWGENDADKKFLQGYLAASAHEERLLEAFGVEKQPETIRPIPPL